MSAFDPVESRLKGERAASQTLKALLQIRDLIVR